MSMPPTNKAPARAPAAAGFIWRTLYGVYAWTLFVVLALSAVCTAILPGVQRRRRAARKASRALIKLAGLRLTVKSAEKVPLGQCVIVANHASYLDGVVFTAVLPP